MKKFAILMLLSVLFCFGCKKAPDNTPENVPANETAQPASSENEAGVNNAIPESEVSAENAVINTGKSAKLREHSILNSFDKYGLDGKELVPDFAYSFGTKNGTFQLLKPGFFVYFLVSTSDNAITEAQFADYCTHVFEHIKSRSDNNEVWSFDKDQNAKIEKLESAPAFTFESPLQLAYTHDGIDQSIFVLYKKYNPGMFVDISSEMYAVYVGVFEF